MSLPVYAALIGIPVWILALLFAIGCAAKDGDEQETSAADARRRVRERARRLEGPRRDCHTLRRHGGRVGVLARRGHR